MSEREFTGNQTGVAAWFYGEIPTIIKPMDNSIVAAVPRSLLSLQDNGALHKKWDALAIELRTTSSPSAILQQLNALERAAFSAMRMETAKQDTLVLAADRAKYAVTQHRYNEVSAVWHRHEAIIQIEKSCIGGRQRMMAEYHFDPEWKALAKYETEVRAWEEEVREKKLPHLCNKAAFMSNIEILRYMGSIYAAQHAKDTYADIERYAKDHGTTAEAVIARLEAGEFGSKNVHSSLLKLLNASYTESDLDELKQSCPKITTRSSPEARAFAQFINHSFNPHYGNFKGFLNTREKISSYLNELTEHKADQLSNTDLVAIGDRTSALLDQLDAMISTHPLSTDAKAALSDRRTLHKYYPGDAPPEPSQTELAHKQETKRHADSLALVASLVDDLHNPSKGTIKEHHHFAKQQSLEELRGFNGFFSGIEVALRKVDAQLAKATAERDNVEFRWERADGVVRELKSLALNDPEIMLKERKHGDRLAAAGTASSGNVWNALTGYGANQTRNKYWFDRASALYEINRASAESRNRIDPTELDAALQELDAEVLKLQKNKEFYTYLSNSQLTQNTRAVFTFLPRLIAGENNIDAMEIRAERLGYQKIDDFIDDLRKKSPRLGNAMESYLFGLADSNDIKVIIAEANGIGQPSSKADTLLVDYVEKVIKRHYPDQSRQASTVDCLAMHNVIPTRHKTHSFGEVVKLETDAALRALLSGTGDFSLVGSGDVHDIFSYYQARHGDGALFVDPHDKSKVAKKYVQTSAPADLEFSREQAIRLRAPDTKIPRISNVFLEICAHEYLLSQGMNTVKNRGLASAPQALGSLEMVNSVTKEFIGRLALYEGRIRAKRVAEKGGNLEADYTLGNEIESLIARSFVDFFSELGAQHMHDRRVADKSRKVHTAFSGENFSLANETYTEVITEDGKNNFDLFLQVYQKNLETYLGVATRENRKLLIEQIDAAKDIVASIQIPDNVVLPESETARLQAHYENHSLSNVGLNHSTWVERAEAVVNGGTKIVR